MFSKNKASRSDILISEQIKDVDACLIRFESFLRAASSPEATFETLRVLSDAVGEAEGAADKSLRRMIDSLGGNFLPSTRQDLISIATSCDRVANKCEAFAQMAIFQRFRFPAEYMDEALEILSVSRNQFTLLEKSIRMLFSDISKLLRDHSILDDIRAAESRVDAIEQSLYERIFAMDIGLAERRQIAEFVGLLADISDLIENIADKIQIMLITRKA
ncbi:MAG: DUF47 family protein [Clostridia bacterium]|nr:DUF47 family protein [Clostridia bacterium]MBO5670907.1 DUF47 family protein [Clostridia bacterium]